MSHFDKITKRNEFFYQRDKEVEDLIDPNTGKIPEELLEKINCPLCGSFNYKKIFDKNGLDFVRCQDCTLVYVNPRLKEESIVKFYHSAKKAPSRARALDFLSSPKQQEIDIEMYNELLDELSEYAPLGNVLDIGCSFGLFLHTANKRGYNVQGLELNEEAANMGREKFGLKIEPKLLNEAGFRDESFDIVSMFGVIEHLPKPMTVMKEVYRILKPGGIFVGRCPNMQGFVYMVLHELGRTFAGKSHLTYFSKETLTRVFNETGLKTLKIDTFVTGKDSILNYFQFLDPFGDEEYRYLPKKFRDFILDEENFKKLEKVIYDLDLGMKLKFIAQKPKE